MKRRSRVHSPAAHPMFDDLARELEQRLFGAPAAADTPLAVAVIVTAIGQAGPERRSIDAATVAATLAELLGTDADAAAERAAKAHALAADAALALYPYTHAFRGASDYDQRRALIRALWRLVLARGESLYEAAYVDKVASLLGIAREVCLAERWRILNPADTGAPPVRGGR